jgi:lysylphosphatidylglycerol synthetase-like protein (DUF2156 family)
MTVPEAPPEARDRPSADPAPATVLAGAGLVFLALGAVLGAAYVVGDIRTSLFPTGWLFAAILLMTGGLMTIRRRFDVVATLWAGMAVAVFMLDVQVYMRTLDQGFEDPGAFDATVIVAVLGLVPLLLRRSFRS